MRRALLATLAMVVAAIPLHAQEWTCPEPGPLVGSLQGALAHVRYLADDALEGRAVATRGERCAGAYLAEQFEAMGLEPAAPDGTYFQSWEVRTGTALGPNNRLRVGSQDLVPNRDWVPYGFSASLRVDAMLVGVPETGDPGNPADVDHGSMAGAVLVVEGGAPHPHAAPIDAHRVASSSARMGVGAVVVLLGEGDPLPALEVERRAALAIPVIAVGGEAAEGVRSAVAAGDRAQLTVEVEPVRNEARNVVALLPGSDRAGPTVVVGAHYDHLGLGGSGSLSPNAAGVVHNGADDNASGTAVLLEVARELARGPALRPKVLFLAFTGEENGLWGSAHYAEAPLLPLDETTAMLNMDMVGRVRDGSLTVFGTGTAEEWPRILERANASTSAPLELQFVSDGFGASDHSSFYAQGIPVLHFFSNTHPEYHRVEDDWDLINAEGMERVGALVTAVVREMAPASGVLALTPVEGAGNPHGTGPTDGSTVRSGFSVRLGTIPDYSQESGGMRITGVRDGSPAAKAGLKGGDVIVRFGEHEVEDVYGYMYALQEFSPGDEVPLVILRDGTRMVVSVVLEASN